MDQFCCCAVAKSCPTLRPHGPQHTRPPSPSPTPGVCSNSSPSSQWCHPTISSSVVPFSSCLQSFPASGSFPMSQLFGGQSVGASASVLPLKIYWIFHWFPLAWTSLIGLPKDEWMSEWILTSLNRTEQECRQLQASWVPRAGSLLSWTQKSYTANSGATKREIRLGRRNSHTKPEADTSIISSYTDTTAAVETQELLVVDTQCPAKRSFSRSQPTTWSSGKDLKCGGESQVSHPQPTVWSGLWI